MPDVPVPFSDEEIERLTTLADALGATIPQYVRLRVFSNVDLFAGASPEDILALREGKRLRARPQEDVLAVPVDRRRARR